MRITVLLVLLLCLNLFKRPSLFAQTPEDICSAIPTNEISLSLGCGSPVAVTINNSFTNSGSLSCNASSDNDGWFWFTGNGTFITIESTMDKDHGMELWSSCGGYPIDCVTATSGSTASISIYSSVGHVYYLMVDRLISGGGPTMNGTVCINGYGVTTVEPGPAGHSAQIPLPVAWLDADVGVTGSPFVSSWADRSPSGTDVLQGNPAYQPTLIASDPIYNYHQALYGDGDDYMSNFYLLNYDSDATVYFVGRPENLSGRKTGVGFGDIYDTNDGDDPRVGINDEYFAVHHDQSSPGVEDSVYFWTTPVTTDQNYVLGTRWAATTGSGWVDTRVNSWNTIHNSLTIYSGTVGEIFSVFGSDDPSSEQDNWIGTINEVIVYDFRLTTGPSLIADAYLAIKYGITLGQNGTGSNYFGSNGILYWAPASSPGYNYDIAGLAKDDIVSLDQRISHSTNMNGAAFRDILTIAHGPNFSSPEPFILGRSAFMWGNNNGALTNTGTIVNYATDNGELIETIFSRQWSSQETGLIQDVSLEFDLSNVAGFNGIYGNNDLANVRLLVDEDGDFSDGNATAISPTSYDNVSGLVYFSHDFLPSSGVESDQFNGFYFTLGSTNSSVTPLSGNNLSVEGLCRDQVIQLDWESTYEMNVATYEILLSTDGENFNPVQSINANGTTGESAKYSITTSNLFDYTFALIRSHDFNNLVIDSSLLYFECKPSVSLFPNPAHDNFRISSEYKGDLEITILNLTGQPCFQEIIPENMERIVDVRPLEKGVYQIRVIENDQIHFLNFVKQ